MPYKNFTPSQLTASEVNTYLMNQSVMVFANSAARSASLTLPTEGMVTYLQDTDELEIYNGSAWLRAVVTSDDESITTSGSLTVGADLTVDTTTLKVDSANNRVGIGTASPALQTHIYAGNSGSSYNAYTTHLRIENNSTTGISMHTPTANFAVIGHATPLDGSSSAIGFDGSDRSLNFSTVNGTVRMKINSNGHITKPFQPYVQLKGQGGNWYQPPGVLGTNTPSGFSWGVVTQRGGSNWNGNNAFIAPLTGVYLCSFQTYQQTYGGTSWIHWLWQVGGALGWNGSTTPYNIFGYSDSAYADGAGMTMCIYVTAGTGISIYGGMGGDERFYSDYTYMSFCFLG